MTSRDTVVVKQLTLTHEELQAAIERATESVKRGIIWHDPGAPKRPEMTVYLVWETLGGYDGSLCGVFSTAELAQQYAARRLRDHSIDGYQYHVEAMVVDARAEVTG